MPDRTTPTVDRKNMTTRIITGLVFAVFFLTLLWHGDRPWAAWAYLGLMGLGILGGVRELTLMARVRGFRPSLVAGLAVAWGLLAHFFLLTGNSDPLPLWAVLAGGLLVIHFGALFFDRALEEALPSQAITWMGALALGLGLGFQQRLFMLQGDLPKTGSRFVLALFIITWFGDTAAYFVGTFLGKHKLAPRVSPKKSLEGAAGNLAGNLAGAFLMIATVCPDWTWIDAVALGLLMGVAGQLGDLVESTWKRSAGVKDS
ncbi:MAG TPA: phosphatidate cytidylyltransferase, partial [Holophagaceae bacterium]